MVWRRSSARRPILVVHAAGFLFDVDGVLVDSAASVEKHWREIAAEIGVDATKLLQRVHGRCSIDVIKELPVGTSVDAGRLYQSLIDRDRHDLDGTVALPGARCTLENLPPNRWAVVTSGTRDVAIARLHAASLPLPVVMVTADDVAAGKPDPSPYQIGAAALGLDTRDCVVIEETPPGVQSGQAAGFRTLALLTTHSREDLVRADLAGSNLAAFAFELLPRSNSVPRHEGAVETDLAGSTLISVWKNSRYDLHRDTAFPGQPGGSSTDAGG
jgi:mannitol-1-/sugar-/sorbitol-6-phosphatase